jgi:hypothetical protein
MRRGKRGRGIVKASKSRIKEMNIVVVMLRAVYAILSVLLSGERRQLSITIVELYQRVQGVD